MYDEPLSPNEGACCGEAETPHEEGACVRYAMNRYRYRQMRGMFKICDELLSTYVACLRYMVNRNRHMRGVFKMYGEPDRQMVDDLSFGAFHLFGYFGVYRIYQ